MFSKLDKDTCTLSMGIGVGTDDGSIPEWAKVLEPVKKLPTNVGSRIRRCVKAALNMNPPEWAKKQLDASISKGVYKGNASGPTKVKFQSVLLSSGIWFYKFW